MLISGAAAMGWRPRFNGCLEWNLLRVRLHRMSRLVLLQSVWDWRFILLRRFAKAKERAFAHYEELNQLSWAQDVENFFIALDGMDVDFVRRRGGDLNLVETDALAARRADVAWVRRRRRRAIKRIKHHKKVARRSKKIALRLKKLYHHIMGAPHQ